MQTLAEADRDLLTAFVRGAAAHQIADDFRMGVREVRGLLQELCGFDVDRARAVLADAVDSASVKPVRLDEVKGSGSDLFAGLRVEEQPPVADRPVVEARPVGPDVLDEERVGVAEEPGHRVVGSGAERPAGNGRAGDGDGLEVRVGVVDDDRPGAGGEHCAGEADHQPPPTVRAKLHTGKSATARQPESGPPPPPRLVVDPPSAPLGHWYKHGPNERCPGCSSSLGAAHAAVQAENYRRARIENDAGLLLGDALSTEPIHHVSPKPEQPKPDPACIGDGCRCHHQHDQAGRAAVPRWHCNTCGNRYGMDFGRCSCGARLERVFVDEPSRSR